MVLCGLQEAFSDKCIIVINCNEGVQIFLQHWNLLSSGVPGWGGFNPPLPLEIPKALQSHAKTQPDCENC